MRLKISVYPELVPPSTLTKSIKNISKIKNRKIKGNLSNRNQRKSRIQRKKSKTNNKALSVNQEILIKKYKIKIS